MVFGFFIAPQNTIFRFFLPSTPKSQPPTKRLFDGSVAALVERRGCSVPLRTNAPSGRIYNPLSSPACVVCVSFAPFALNGCSAVPAVPAVRFSLTSDLCILTSFPEPRTLNPSPPPLPPDLAPPPPPLKAPPSNALPVPAVRRTWCRGFRLDFAGVPRKNNRRIFR